MDHVMEGIVRKDQRTENKKVQPLVDAARMGRVSRSPVNQKKRSKKKKTEIRIYIIINENCNGL